MKRVFYAVALIICLLGLGFIALRDISNDNDSVVDSNTTSAVMSEKGDIAVEDESTSTSQTDNVAQDRKMYIAIIVDDIGINKSTFENIIKLPNSVTLGFSPYPDDVTELIARAVDLGFEAIIKIPMQTKSYPMEDLGPYTLLDDLSDYENDSRVQIVFSRSDDIVGVYTNPGEIITDYIDNVRHILKSFAILLDASKNPLVFLYSDEYDKKPITRAAAELNIMENICLIDIALDNGGSSEDILEKIADLEMIAKSRGVAVGIIRPYQANIEILQKWMETLKEKQIEIKPLTLFMKERSKIASGN
ncbi:MAG: divergent polysaccharide deacetylase family protein [Candidatus Lariskella arthropodorum]